MSRDYSESVSRQLLIPPSVEMVTLADVRTALRLQALGDDTDAAEDVLLLGYQAAARRYSEIVKGRAYVAQTWQQQQYELCWPIRLLPCPVQQVISIIYLDLQGEQQTLDPDLYRLDLMREPARVVPAVNAVWPATLCGPGAVTIEYIAGYLTPVEFNATTEFVTAKGGRTYTAGDRIVFSNQGGDLPSPLDPSLAYYVINPSGSTFQIATTANGSAIDIATGGTGTYFIGQIPEEERVLIYLLTHHFYENRLVVVPGAAVQLPFTLDALIWNNRVFE